MPRVPSQGVADAGHAFLVALSLMPVARLVPWGYPPDQTAEQVRLILAQGYWVERDPKLPRDKQVGPRGSVQWEFNHETGAVISTDLENEAQQWSGDLRLRTLRDPIWFDIRYNDSDRKLVQVGVIRFDGARIHWLKGESVNVEFYDAAKGDLKARPKAFTSPEGRPLYVILELVPG